MPRSVVVRLEGVEQAGRAAGPGLALGEVGHQVGQVGDVEDAVLVVVALDQPDQPASASARRFATKIESGSLGATCTTTMS